LTASYALKDPWIRKYAKPKNSESEELKNSLDGLRTFRTQMTFQKAVLAYIASQELTKSEEKKLKDAFDFIDIDKNGIISREELVNAYLQLYNDENLAIKEANRVMMRIDINQNGSIDYNEFLMANLAVQGILTPERLSKAFDFFDTVSFFY